MKLTILLLLLLSITAEICGKDKAFFDTRIEKSTFTFKNVGLKDTDVPFSQSLEFSNALSTHEVPIKLIEMKGFGHAFGTHEGGLENEEIQKVFNNVIDFLEQAGN